jgi:hypothetical protein
MSMLSMAYNVYTVVTVVTLYLERNKLSPRRDNTFSNNNSRLISNRSKFVINIKIKYQKLHRLK